MNKNEFEKNTDDIIAELQDFIDKLYDITSPLDYLEELLSNIGEVQDELGFDTGIDFDDVLQNALISLIENSINWDNLNECIDNYKELFSDWEDEDEENADLIRKNFIEPLDDIFDGICIDDATDVFDFERMLNNARTQLEEFLL